MRLKSVFAWSAGGLMALGTIAIASSPPSAAEAPRIAPEEAHALAVNAYLYFYPLITMDVTRRVSTNFEPGVEPGKGPMNMFNNMPAFPSADFRVVVRPNFDTLYSSAWLDLTKGPAVVSVPEVLDRYYLLPLMDMWTDVFASPGTRTTGTQAHDFLVTPPGWSGEPPAGMTAIASPTPYAWIIGRTQTNGPTDYEAVHKIQAGYKITPLAEWGKAAAPPKAVIDPMLDMKTPPKIQVDTMPANRFFARAAELLKVVPPHLTDQPIIAQLKRIGFEPGKSFDLDKADPVIRDAFATAPEDAQRLMAWKVPTLGRFVHGWTMLTDTMGVYGNYYLKRAIIAQWGLGANLPEDAIYPANLTDEAGQPLDGAHKYTLHFDKGATPPVDAFWSVTLYDNDGFQVANPMNRFALSSWAPLKTNADGSLDLYFQSESPGADRQANWLPAPKGPFNLMMRLYAPKAEALVGKWAPPPVVKEATAPPVSAQ